MKSCKYCQSEHTHKCGINKSGSQRYYCRECKRYYTPKPTPKAGVYPPEMHKKVAEMYIDGLNLRRIGRQMHINHQTVANWINKLTKEIDPEQAPIPELGEWDTVELDELYTFVGQKKNRIYLVTQVHRKTGCFMNWLTISERTAEQMQPIVDGSAQAFQYCSDGASVYEALNYHRGYHLVAEGKTQTYSVEAKNAELRHYLARLAKHTRCFSRSLEALRGAIALFIDCWNRRQLHKLKYPRYNYSLIDFLPLVK